jgi:hypothetical protein
MLRFTPTRSPSSGRPLRGHCAILVAGCLLGMSSPALAIEMFTFFGDGSRIGLPSLEVPIEAYPGIPIRSDRLRARRRALRGGPGTAVRIGPPGYARGITIRAMPTAPGGTSLSGRPQSAGVPIAPEPPPLPGLLDGAEIPQSVAPGR